MYEKIPKNTITKIAIVKTDCKLTLSQVVAQQHCRYAINGGLYDMKTGKVNSIPLRIDGKTIATSNDGYWCFAWNIGPDIRMIHSSEMNNYRNVFACSTMLKDGKETIFNYTSAQGGIRGRTGFGDDDTQVHLFVTTDKSGALFPKSLRSKMKAEGAKNAIMCDCGGSSQGYFNGQYVQYENRKVAYWICIWTKEVDEPSKSKCPYKEPTVNIYNGSRGESAKWAQWYLNKTGKYNLTIDGIFGKASVAALKDFQKQHGLKVDGICGQATRNALKSVCQKGE